MFRFVYVVFYLLFTFEISTYFIHTFLENFNSIQLQRLTTLLQHLN